MMVIQVKGPDLLQTTDTCRGVSNRAKDRPMYHRQSRPGGGNAYHTDLTIDYIHCVGWTVNTFSLFRLYFQT